MFSLQLSSIFFGAYWSMEEDIRREIPFCGFRKSRDALLFVQKAIPIRKGFPMTEYFNIIILNMNAFGIYHDDLRDNGGVYSEDPNPSCKFINIRGNILPISTDKP